MKEQISYSRYHTRLLPAPLLLQYKAVLLRLGGVNHFSEVIFTAFTIVIPKHTNMHAHTCAFLRGLSADPSVFIDASAERRVCTEVSGVSGEEMGIQKGHCVNRRL